MVHKYLIANNKIVVVAFQKRVICCSSAILQEDTKSIHMEIPGLLLIEDFLSEEEQQLLVQKIDNGAWEHEQRGQDKLGRRSQQYGYRYSYTTQDIEILDGPFASLPEYCKFLVERLLERNYYPYIPDQLIINEYTPGQGIVPHVDRTHCFGDCIAGVSLLSGCFMDFRNTKTLVRKSIYLKPRSLMVMKGDARFLWTHSIKSRTYDTIQKEDGTSETIERARRISLTFRKIIHQSQASPLESNAENNNNYHTKIE